MGIMTPMAPSPKKRNPKAAFMYRKTFLSAVSSQGVIRLYVPLVFVPLVFVPHNSAFNCAILAKQQSASWFE